MTNAAPAGLDSTFGALSDSTRRSILNRLSQSELTVTELAAPYAMSLAAISKHLRVLTNAGLIRQEKLGRIRRCHLEPQRLQEAAEWIASYQQFWEDRLDSLAGYLDQSDHKENPTCPAHKENSTPSSKSAAASPRRAKKSSKLGRKKKR